MTPSRRLRFLARLSPLRRVRNESARERRRQLALFADHAARDEIGVGVIVDGDDLRRPVRFALEFDVARGSILAAAMTRTDFFLCRRWSSRARRAVVGSTGFGARFGLFQLCQRLRLAPEQRNADYAHIVRTAGAGGIGIAQVGEIEPSDFLQALAPAGNGQWPAALDHIAPLA